ncbi:MAG: alanine racemase [Gammaproteobacteria bacterium]|nr:alanine racemase [Gammaproteobacteria bacterium]
MRAHAKINLNSLKHNLQRVRQLSADTRVMSVIKANAYGHGMLQVADALQDSDAFAVANIEEACRLRSHMPDKKIIILQGILSQEELSLVFKLGLDIVIHNELQLQLIEQSLLSGRLSVWLKIDTGMHRLGFRPDKVNDAVERLQLSVVGIDIQMMSHFANADDPSDSLNEKQCQTFFQATGSYAMQKSIANSAAICSDMDCSLDWVRPGIMLYGVNPFLKGLATDLDLQPVMTLSATVISLQQFSKGEAIGYGGSWTCPEDMPVAIISIGYGDGYPRHAESGTPILVNGVICPLVGRVSMDMICVDVRNASSVMVGNEVVLWGNDLPIEKVANASKTIAYELLCKLTQRVHFEYV